RSTRRRGQSPTSLLGDRALLSVHPLLRNKRTPRRQEGCDGTEGGCVIQTGKITERHARKACASFYSLLLRTIRLVFLPPFPEANSSYNAEHQILQCDKSNTFYNIQPCRYSINNNPEHPRFNLLVNNQKRRDNAHDRDERIQIRKGTGFGENCGKDLVNILGQATH